jgi:hypothetical protein
MITPILVLLVPALGLVVYICMFGVNVVFWDEWDFVPFLKAAMNGTLSYASLFAQHNEHRLFFPRIVMIALAQLTRYNTIAEMIFGWFMILATALLVFRASWVKFSAGGPWKFALIFVPASLLLFTYRQFEVALFGFPSVQFYMMILGVVGSFYLLGYSNGIDIGFAFSCLAAFMASFSSIQGLLAWPIGLVQILLSASRRKAIIWAISGALVTSGYLYGWTKPVQTPSLNNALSDPLGGLRYFFVLLGAPFSYELYTAMGFGALVFLVGVVVFWRNRLGEFVRRNGIWFSLLLFGILSCVVTTAGRSGFGLPQGLSSRYTPVTAIGIIGLYFLSLDANGLRAKRKKLAARVLLTVILVGSIISYSGGWVAGDFLRCRYETSAYVLRTYQTQPDENITTWLYPSHTPSIRERAAFLEENKLNVFSQSKLNASSRSSTECQTLFRVFEFYEEFTNGTMPATVFSAEAIGSLGIGLPIVVASAVAIAIAVMIALTRGNTVEEPPNGRVKISPSEPGVEEKYVI